MASIGVLAVSIVAAVAGLGPRTARLKAALAAAGDGAEAAPAELDRTGARPAAARRHSVPGRCPGGDRLSGGAQGVRGEILPSLLVAAAAVVAVCWHLVSGRGKLGAVLGCPREGVVPNGVGGLLGSTRTRSSRSSAPGPDARPSEHRAPPSPAGGAIHGSTPDARVRGAVLAVR
jgi:hypothetical protein